MILWYVQFLKSKMINIELFSVGSHGKFYLNIASYASCMTSILHFIQIKFFSSYLKPLVLAHWNNSLWIVMSPHSDPLSWFWAKQSCSFSKMINIELFSVGSHGKFYLNIASYASCILRHFVDWIPLSQIKIVLFILANRECLIRRRRCINIVFIFAGQWKANNTIFI
jgi:hypothetical protein